MKSFNEIRNSIDEAMKYTHVAVDSKGKLIGLSTKESDAVDMARRNKGKALKLMKPISQRKGDMMVNRTLGGVMGDAKIVKNFMEEVDLEEKKFSFGAPESVVLDKVEKMIANTKNAPEAYKLIANKMKVTDATAKKLVNKVIDRSLKGKKK
tara:strand:+ start:1938 stop:2393 length:456 start_codon:yes stop_codon:yes gene_type:complete